MANGLNDLGISHGDPAPGEAELGLFIPRHGENLTLAALVDEGEDLDRLVAISYEITEGTSNSPEVSYLTSCDYGLLVLVSPIPLKFLLECIDKALDIVIKAAAAKRALNELRGTAMEDVDVDVMIEKKMAKQREELSEIVRVAVTDASKASEATQNDQIARLTSFIEKFVEKHEQRGNYIDVRVSVEIAPAADAKDAAAVNERIIQQQRISVIAQHIVSLEQVRPPTIAAIAPPTK